jgi:thioredoxin 1
VNSQLGWHVICLIIGQACDAVENMNSNESESLVVEIGEANFYSEVLQSKRPVLVAFLAPWSRPCQILKPVLDEVVTACAGSVKIAWVNADDNPNLSLWYGIQSIPTLLCFADARPRARVVGTVSKQAILAELKPFTQTA